MHAGQTKKENRIKRSSLWNRLLFRAADSLAKEKLISRPTHTVKLTGQKEWMLTEAGFDAALNLMKIPVDQKDELPIKSVEIQEIVNKIIDSPAPKDYIPIGAKAKTTTHKISLRKRGFRQAVIEAYDCRCAVCGLKLHAPHAYSWEVQAAHIVPRSKQGKDDIWNGVALCRLHHWAFDVGWFTLQNNYSIQISSQTKSLLPNIGKMNNIDFFQQLTTNKKIYLPEKVSLYPHSNSLNWHRQNIFQP